MTDIDDGTLVVVCAADDAFAMPLAVMACSVLDNLNPKKRLLLYVIDGGITKRNKRKIESSLDLSRITLKWLTPDFSKLSNLKVSDHISYATYFRILIPDIIPESFHKAIYLDCDLVVIKDLDELWCTSFNGKHLLAVQDMAAPYMRSSKVLKNYDHCGPYLSDDTALINYRELGLTGDYKYFNAGVLVINLDKWREDNISETVINYLHTNKKYVRWWDQDGLNAILAGKWKELDLRWNQGARIYRYPSWGQSPYEKHLYNKILSNPYIIHFSMASKPWHFDCSHPARDLFFHYLDMTAWAGWRPKSPLKKVFMEYLSSQKKLISQKLKMVLR
jgi:lipopolysaccharide biosynthesis glycosyltransferase